MSLTAALNTARSSLAATSAQISVSSRNVSGASDPTYSRKLAPTITNPDGSARVVQVSRATDSALYFTMLSATSKAAGQEAIASGLEQLSATIGDPQADQSPAGRLSALTTALQQFANEPDSQALAERVLMQAGELASTVNNAAQTVQKVRQTADADISASVTNINELLSRFEKLNNQVVQGTFAGRDISDALDQRDAVLSSLSEEMGVSVVSRANNDMVIYTDSGVTLFETRARTVTFQPSNGLTPGVAGNAVYIDGVQVTGAGATMPLRGGALHGLSELRDTVAGTYEAQLDELARGLVEAFAETDQIASGQPDAAGLFTWDGGPAVPASGTRAAGIALTLKVNPSADPVAGGNLDTLRDGGMSGAAYVYNTSGAAAFGDRLDALSDALSADRSFDGASRLQATQNLLDFSTSSAGWLEGQRSSVSADLDYQKTLVSHASDALSNATGVNLDDEYALQLQLERSYAAASKLFGVVADLFDTLMQNVR
ncbi:flagellar hook-associated protein FlgK [Afifella sp. IM 167]|uniref:flagellar hook-associated protein FlgK n=1 Tax=Afifella sp. IM 167 TaxID=2033586 RepID=UPI001CCE13D7|nr:flagellar hook-associated protein FlgK [Afifella sp. IM 167]MBZ8131798.1 flagellar hook-associated protein FlgK [Afifella sp. IM 167]